METLPIPPARNPRPASAEGSTAVSRKAPVPEDRGDAEGQVSATGFSKLLKSAGQQGDDAVTALDVQQPAAGLLPSVDIAATLSSLPVLASDALESIVPLMEQATSVLVPADALPEPEGAQQSLLGSDMTWSLQSLVGQTARLDQSAEVAVRNGTHLQARSDMGGWSSAQSIATAALGVAAHVPVVAQGVMPTAGEGIAPAGLTVATSAASLSVAAGVAQSLEDGLGGGTGAERSDALADVERSSEGRMSLQGQWTAAERSAQPTEVMQRLLAQMSQFLSATGATEVAGLRRSGVKSVDDATLPAQDVAALHSGSTLGTGRLMEQAVAQTTASQQAQNGDASAAQAEPEVAYWMNARQQRAEVVLDRGGDPVRVQVQLEGNAAHVTFLSDESATRSMLDASISQLRDLLAAQGVELAGVQVNTQSQPGQGGGSSAQERFVPEGAGRMRLAVEGAEQSAAPSAYQGRISQRSVDIFA